MYRLLRPLFFLLPPELAHRVALTGLTLLYRLGLVRCRPSEKQQGVFDLHFDNRLGIAAGLDKNGDYIDCLAALGVGFIEVGAVTPLPQAGNPKPRLFRLPAQQALINKMGFNNKGVDYLVNNLKKRKTDCIVGVNLGKNKTTPLANAADDYNICLRKIYPYADFATINISSPNTPGLRELQGDDYLPNLLQQVKQQRDELATQYNKSLPLLVKIAPDLSIPELQSMLSAIQQAKLDGIIATNTTASRDGVSHLAAAQHQGGLSGRPLAEKSRTLLHLLKSCQLPIISVGGIDSPSEAKQRLQQGATLLQVYTGLIYQGPGLLKRIIKTIEDSQ